MKKLVIYREGTKTEIKELYPDADTYLNVKCRGFDDILGMRFSDITVCGGCTTLDFLKAGKFYYSGRE